MFVLVDLPPVITRPGFQISIYVVQSMSWLDVMSADRSHKNKKMFI